MLACTLEELGQRMSVDEFYLWLQFEAESPMQDVRSDIHAAQISTAVVNMAGKAMKEPVSLRSQILFLPEDNPKPKSAPLDFFKKGK